MLDLIEIALKRNSFSYARIDGNLSKNQRQNALNDFKLGKQVMLISLKAGGIGLNLTHASRVILMDPWWNQSIENQAIERVHRIGQTKNVKAYKLICKDTVESNMLAVQERKRDIVEGACKEKMSAENLIFVFRDNL